MAMFPALACASTSSEHLPTASQTSTTPPASMLPQQTTGIAQFEVASLRPIDPNAASDPPWTINLDASDYSRYTGGLVAANGFLINYIIFAYKITDTTQYPMIDAQLPKWAQSAHSVQFHLEARAEGKPTKDQIRLMMQSLLKDRFHLAVHFETRELPVYALVLDKPGKPGPQLTPTPPDSPCIAHAQPITTSDTKPYVYCAPLFIRGNDGLTHMKINGWTMQQIAGDIATTAVNMGGLTPRPVLDKTGLHGWFDIKLDFVRESRTPQPPNDASAPEVSGLIFTGALKKQAGLLLVKQRGPVDVMVVDHVDELSEN